MVCRSHPGGIGSQQICGAGHEPVTRPRLVGPTRTCMNSDGVVPLQGRLSSTARGRRCELGGAEPSVGVGAGGERRRSRRELHGGRPSFKRKDHDGGLVSVRERGREEALCRAASGVIAWSLPRAIVVGSWRSRMVRSALECYGLSGRRNSTRSPQKGLARIECLFSIQQLSRQPSAGARRRGSQVPDPRRIPSQKATPSSFLLAPVVAASSDREAGPGRVWLPGTGRERAFLALQLQ